MKQAAFIFLMVVLTWCGWGCKSTATYPIDEPMAATMNNGILGKWKIEEDTDKRNYYLVEPGLHERAVDRYHIKFYNRGGTNRTYESELYYSLVKGQPFINIKYAEWGGDAFKNEGFFFLKVLEVNKDYSKLTLAMVADTTMGALKNSAEVKKRITTNLNNPKFYTDTVHLFKTWM
jgi:hypothetical protein